MGSLLYLELRYAAHQVRAILHSPLRLAIWIPYTIAIGLLAYGRTRNLAGPHASAAIVLEARYATAAAGAYFGLLGIAIGLAATGRVVAFRSAAEAVLLVNAGIRPLHVALWLQIRKLMTTWTRWTGAIVYVFLIVAPHHVDPDVTARAFVAALLAVALQLGIELPVFLLATRGLALPLAASGYALAAVGFGFGVIGVLGDRLRRPVLRAIGFDPGTIADAVLRGSPIAIVVLIAIVAFLVIAIGLLADDSLPEFYAVSQRSFALRRRRRATLQEARFVATPSTRADRIPRGALALLWKDWIGFRRGPGIFRLWALGCAFWSTCGAGVAVAVVRFHDYAPLISLTIAAGLLLLATAPFGASAGLADDLSKPIFWLSSAPLRSRIAAWTLGRALRGGVAIGLAPFMAGAVLGNAPLALGALPFALGTYWSLQSLGVGLYAAFPDPVDARGPMALLRLIVTLAYVVPAAVLALWAAALAMPPVVIALAFVSLLTLQGWAVVELASRRFREHGAVLRTISTAT